MSILIVNGVNGAPRFPSSKDDERIGGGGGGIDDSICDMISYNVSVGRRLSYGMLSPHHKYKYTMINFT